MFSISAVCGNHYQFQLDRNGFLVSVSLLLSFSLLVPKQFLLVSKFAASQHGDTYFCFFICSFSFLCSWCQFGNFGFNSCGIIGTVVLSFLIMSSSAGLNPFSKEVNLYANFTMYISHTLVSFFVDGSNSSLSSYIRLRVFEIAGDVCVKPANLVNCSDEYYGPLSDITTLGIP